MYYPNQIVWDKETKAPAQIPDDIWDITKYPKRSTHFIRANDKGGYEIALPKSVEEAALLMAQGIIVPAPTPPTHCWKCGNWLSNHNSDGSCWERK